MNSMLEHVFRLTPLGRADSELRRLIDDEEESIKERFSEYERSLSKYRNAKLTQIVVKILLYAGVITSIAASFGVEEIQIISKISSYIGVSFLLVGYVFANYFTMLYREEYHVKREILISNIELNFDK